MRLLLKICEDYARELHIVFNATKSATMCIARRKARFCENLQYCMDGKSLATVNEFPTIGPYFIITSNLNDKSDQQKKFLVWQS